MSFPVPSGETKEFAVSAMGSYSKLLEDEDTPPLPQVFIENIKGDRSIVVVQGGEDLETGTQEDHVVVGRKLLAALRDRPDAARRAALAYDAVLTLDGERTSAIVVEILEGPATQTFVQRYARPRGREIQFIGEPSFLPQPSSQRPGL